MAFWTSCMGSIPTFAATFALSSISPLGRSLAVRASWRVSPCCVSSITVRSKNCHPILIPPLCRRCGAAVCRLPQADGGGRGKLHSPWRSKMPYAVVMCFCLTVGGTSRFGISAMMNPRGSRYGRQPSTHSVSHQMVRPRCRPWSGNFTRPPRAQSKAWRQTRLPELKASI
jgi:hypothetical protein